MAPLVKAFQEHANFTTEICVTAQHRGMLDQVLSLFDITPDYDLDVMQPGQTLHALTTRVLDGMRRVLEDSQPNFIFVHGDTTTSMISALAGFYAQIPIAHIEAGLRTHNLSSPWPEEANRQITGRLAKFHFAPTEQARQNLLAENITDAQICVTGNTVIDALHMLNDKIDTDAPRRDALRSEISSRGFAVVDGRKIILVTAHRRENFGHGFEEICRALAELANNNPDCDIVYPVHLNPNVQGPVYDLLGDTGNIHLIAPLDYEPFIWLMREAHIVLTDSGGIQEEAPSLGKPVLVMRATTERPEAVAAGTVRLVGASAKDIVAQTQALLDDASAYQAMSRAHNPYGDGQACARIIGFLEEQLYD